MVKKKRDRTDAEASIEFMFNSLGIRWEMEYRFNPNRRWRSDYFLPDLNCLVEIEGGIWRGKRGRHTNPTGYQKDCEKYNSASLLGFTLLRFTTTHIKKDIIYVEETIKDAIDSNKKTSDRGRDRVSNKRGDRTKSKGKSKVPDKSKG